MISFDLLCFTKSIDILYSVSYIDLKWINRIVIIVVITIIIQFIVRDDLANTLNEMQMQLSVLLFCGKSLND